MIQNMSNPRKASSDASLVLVGDFTCGSTRPLLSAVHGVFQPHKIVLGNRGPVDPFARTLPLNDECTQAYCCTGNACLPPTRDKKVVREFLLAKEKP